MSSLFQMSYELAVPPPFLPWRWVCVALTLTLGTLRGTLGGAHV